MTTRKTLMLLIIIAALVGVTVGTLISLLVQILAHRQYPVLPPADSNRRLYIQWMGDE